MSARSVAACGAMLLLAACGSETAPTISAPAEAASTSASTPIIAWGDSFTAGATATSAATTYPAQLARITRRDVSNEGVTGIRSEQMAARQGGEPALVTLAGDLMPPAAATVVRNSTPWPVSPPRPTLAGSLIGVHGLMSLHSAGLPIAIGVLFQRDDAGAVETLPKDTPFIPDTAASRTWVNIFWIGRNNIFMGDPNRIVPDLRACVSFLRTDTYIVLPVFNAEGEGRGTSAYDTIMSVNARIAAEFGDHYVDMRRIFIEHGNPANAQDQANVAQDVPPSSLRGDPLHPNDAGYLPVANEIARFIQMRGW